jgi:hypothetical protein
MGIYRTSKILLLVFARLDQEVKADNARLTDVDNVVRWRCDGEKVDADSPFRSFSRHPYWHRFKGIIRTKYPIPVLFVVRLLPLAPLKYNFLPF